MITETITYTDFDDNEHTDTLYFHISEAVILENIDIIDKLQAMLQMSQPPTRTLSTEENQQMLDLVKRFMMLSYGIRLPDGGFDQDEPVGTGPVWKKFKTSSAYNAFVMSLFQPNPARAAVFMYRVLPNSVRGSESDLDIGSLPSELRQTVESELAKDKKVNRLVPGTRIIDDVPVPAPPPAQAAQPSTDESIDPNMDYDALLNEAPKQPITQGAYDTMRGKLNPKQFEHFMSTRYVSTD